MNNEPVAWIIDVNMTDCDDNFIWNTGDYPDWQVKNWIPLYTHPAKILTDEEITDIAHTLLIATDAIEYEWGICVTQFARAILKKASDK